MQHIFAISLHTTDWGSHGQCSVHWNAPVWTHV